MSDWTRKKRGGGESSSLLHVEIKKRRISRGRRQCESEKYDVLEGIERKEQPTLPPGAEMLRKLS